MARVTLKLADHPFSMLSQVFYRHGRMCASHPWEVIIAFLTLIISMLSMGTTIVGTSKVCTYQCAEENKGVEMVLLTIARCVAVLYCYHQFLKLYKLGSTYLVGIGGLFTIFSAIVFSSSVVNFLEGDFSELTKALPFFFLLMDLTKAGLLAQFALSSSTQEEVRENIAQGMSILGPTITLDTIVETLVIGVGTLSGVKRLEELCCFACMSAVVNYFVFMIFFPACLALILELSRDRDEGRPVWHLSTLTRILQHEEEQKPNPVLQRVKVIMSAGLVVVHAHSRWPVLSSRSLDKSTLSPSIDKLLLFPSEHSNWDIYLQRWFGSAEQIVMIVFVMALVVLYLFFESRDDLSEHLASAALSSPSRRSLNYRSTFSQTPVSPTIEESFIREVSYCGLSESAKTSQPQSPRSVSFTMGGEDGDLNKTLIPTSDKEVQTFESKESLEHEPEWTEPRSIEKCKEILKSEGGGAQLTDEEVILLAEKKIIQSHKLETIVQNPKRGVILRRKLILKLAKRGQILGELPYCNYDYRLVMGTCCENVLGYVPIPVGVAGPLLLDKEILYIPMATTEGCLVASTNRGCRALTQSGGVSSCLLGDGMTRGPVIRMPSAMQAGEIKSWIKQKENFQIMKTAFDSTSRFARLQNIKVRTAGPLAFLRFKATTGDAMGMNMLSKGSDEALSKLRNIFPSVEILSLSGNYCTDKKPAAINWIQGRGKEVVCEAKIPAKLVKEVLKTDVSTVVTLNYGKNYIGSAMAGSIGGFNAQAANIVTAIYLATGQDPAQNVTSSNCITQLEPTGEDDKDLYISCTMPSIEVGTVGGGTFLPAQASCLELLGVKGSCDANPGGHAAKLARIVCATVLAGELSLLSALAEGHLVRSHMTHNRSAANIQSGSVESSPIKKNPAQPNTAT